MIEKKFNTNSKGEVVDVTYRLTGDCSTATITAYTNVSWMKIDVEGMTPDEGVSKQGKIIMTATEDNTSEGLNRTGIVTPVVNNESCNNNSFYVIQPFDDVPPISCVRGTDNGDDIVDGNVYSYPMFICSDQTTDNDSIVVESLKYHGNDLPTSEEDAISITENGCDWLKVWRTKSGGLCDYGGIYYIIEENSSPNMRQVTFPLTTDSEETGEVIVESHPQYGHQYEVQERTNVCPEWTVTVMQSASGYYWCVAKNDRYYEMVKCGQSCSKYRPHCTSSCPPQSCDVSLTLSGFDDGDVGTVCWGDGSECDQMIGNETIYHHYDDASKQYFVSVSAVGYIPKNDTFDCELGITFVEIFMEKPQSECSINNIRCSDVNDVPAAGGEYIQLVNPNGCTGLRFDTNSNDWITCGWLESSEPHYNFKIDVENYATGTEPRIGYITIASGSTVACTIKVTQNTPVVIPCSTCADISIGDVSPIVQPANNAGGRSIATFTADSNSCDVTFSASVVTVGDNFLSNLSVSEVSTNTFHVFGNVSKNTLTRERHETISVGFIPPGGSYIKCENVEITQLGIEECSTSTCPSPNPSRINHQSGMTKKYRVTFTSDCWRIVSAVPSNQTLITSTEIDTNNNAVDITCNTGSLGNTAYVTAKLKRDYDNTTQTKSININWICNASSPCPDPVPSTISHEVGTIDTYDITINAPCWNITSLDETSPNIMTATYSGNIIHVTCEEGEAGDVASVIVHLKNKSTTDTTTKEIKAFWGDDGCSFFDISLLN